MFVYVFLKSLQGSAPHCCMTRNTWCLMLCAVKVNNYVTVLGSRIRFYFTVCKLEITTLKKIILENPRTRVVSEAAFFHAWSRQCLLRVRLTLVQQSMSKEIGHRLGDFCCCSSHAHSLCCLVQRYLKGDYVCDSLWLLQTCRSPSRAKALP